MLSSRRAAEDAIESTKTNRDLTWEQAAKRAIGDGNDHNEWWPRVIK